MQSSSDGALCKQQLEENSCVWNKSYSRLGMLLCFWGKWTVYVKVKAVQRTQILPSPLSPSHYSVLLTPSMFMMFLRWALKGTSTLDHNNLKDDLCFGMVPGLPSCQTRFFFSCFEFRNYQFCASSNCFLLSVLRLSTNAGQWKEPASKVTHALVNIR